MLVHVWPRVHRDDGFWGRWLPCKGAVRPDGVVVVAPFLDQDLVLSQGIEDLAVAQFIAETGVEALAVARRRENSPPGLFSDPPPSVSQKGCSSVSLLAEAESPRQRMINGS